MNLRPYYHYSLYSRRQMSDLGPIIAYLLAGVIISGSDYGMFTAVTLLGGGLLAATVIAYIVGLIISYILNRYWVFRHGADQQAAKTNLTRYGLFLLVNLIITYSMLWALQQWFSISPFIGKFIVNAFMLFWVYAGDKFWVFRGQKMGPIKL